MAVETPEHAAIAVNVSAALHAQLRDRPCRVMSSDLRIRVLATGPATYPDVTVACGRLEKDPDSEVTIVNPAVVVEVLSDATEDHDRGEKLEHYKKIPSLKECVLVSHRRRLVESWRREGDGSWSHRQATAGGVLPLESIGCELAVDEVYGGALEE